MSYNTKQKTKANNMKEQTNYDYEKYVQIAKMAKMGWWESDLKNQEYICSDFIVDLLGLESNRISFTEFHQRIREDHRLRLKSEYMSLSYLETYEQMFPIRAKDGEIWADRPFSTRFQTYCKAK